MPSANAWPISCEQTSRRRLFSSLEQAIGRDCCRLTIVAMLPSDGLSTFMNATREHGLFGFPTTADTNLEQSDFVLRLLIGILELYASLIDRSGQITHVQKCEARLDVRP